MSIVPPSTPKATLNEVIALARKAGYRNGTDPVFLVGVRGYYRDTMGKPRVNDRGIYDDAIFAISPTAFAAFNANTDPSSYRKGIASLAPGIWRYKPGIHGLSKPAHLRYPAFVQAAEVTVKRDQTGDDIGWFGINIHRGGRTGTSSLGCQTIPPAQWSAFHALVTAELKRYSQKSFPYVLTQNA